MGGLREKMPWTFRTFLIGTIAIAGIPGFAGFFSKDMILWSAWNGPHYGKIFWAVGLVTAGFTSFYMFRLLILTFFGAPRYTHEADEAHEKVHHVHESPASMLVPLIILALFSIVAGYAGVPPLLGGGNRIEAFLTGPAHGVKSVEGAETLIEAAVMGISVLTAFLGALLAYLFYVARPEWPARVAQRAHAMYAILIHKYYIDEIYDAVIVWPIAGAAREFFWQFIDNFVIDGAVNGAGWLVRRTAGGLRHMQSGYVRTYAGWILLGGILVVAWFLR